MFTTEKQSHRKERAITLVMQRAELSLSLVSGPCFMR